MKDGIEKFGRCLKKENWTFLDEETDPSVQVRKMESQLMDDLEACIPQKILKISSFEKPRINYELKYLERRKKRIYKKWQI